MKAYVVIYGYSDEYEIHSVFMNKEEAETFVKWNNDIPYGDNETLWIEKVELDPSTNGKMIVGVSGHANKDNEIESFTIERLDPKELKSFTGDDIVLYPAKKIIDMDYHHPEKPYNMENATKFYGKIDVSSCKDDLRNCGSYIKEVIKKKLEKRS